MATNKRRGEPPIPANHEEFLTEEQTEALRKLEGFGWDLHVIRRPKFSPVEILLRHSDGKWMQLLDNGELNHQQPVPIRKEDMLEDAKTAEDPWANATDEQGFEFRIPEPPAEAPTVNNEPVPTSGGNNKRPPKVIV